MYLLVAVIKNGKVLESSVFPSDKWSHESAKTQFVDYAQTYISNWDAYNDDDVEECLDKGFVEFGGKGCISITLIGPDTEFDWPE